MLFRSKSRPVPMGMRQSKPAHVGLGLPVLAVKTCGEPIDCAPLTIRLVGACALKPIESPGNVPGRPLLNALHVAAPSAEVCTPAAVVSTSIGVGVAPVVGRMMPLNTGLPVKPGT